MSEKRTKMHESYYRDVTFSPLLLAFLSLFFFHVLNIDSMIMQIPFIYALELLSRLGLREEEL